MNTEMSLPPGESKSHKKVYGKYLPVIISTVIASTITLFVSHFVNENIFSERIKREQPYQAQLSQLIGTWNVTSTPTSDFMGPNTKSDQKTSAYIWIVSAAANGNVEVTVQGETAFPKLTGRWNSKSKILILEGHSTSMLGLRMACWFKLMLDDKGSLWGVRRYLDESPTFMDFRIVAKRT